MIRNVVDVTNPALITVPIRTTFVQLNLPATVAVTYSNGEKEFIAVTWHAGSFDGTTAGQYLLIGDLALPSLTTNYEHFVASATVKVDPNVAPTSVTLSASSFEPDIAPDESIGFFTTQDTDDTQHTYELAGGTGDEHNNLFAISGDELYLISTSNLSGHVQFSIRVRSTDPYHNEVEQQFILTKSSYTPPAADIKIPNSFSPNGDGVNDEWIIVELKYYNEVVIEVYDRAGNRLFHTTDPETTWNGTGIDGKIMLGPFFYIIQIKDTGEVKRGVLMLLRK